MLELLAKIQRLRGKSLYLLLGIVFVVFVILGSLITYISAGGLNKNETASVQNGMPENQSPTTTLATYKGIVTYLGEDVYPIDKITYSLADNNGNDIILLKAPDQKLSIAQGMFVTVTGRKVKTQDGKNDVLQVMEVTLKNGSN